MSEVGLINQRYFIVLKGNDQKIEINSNLERLRVTEDFKWQPNAWYRLKARVDIADDGSGVVRAKAWKKGETEPDKWSIEVPHKTAHRRDHLFNLSNYAAFQIGVPFSLFEKAENAVKEAFDLDPTDPEAVHILTAPIFRPESRDIIRKLPATLTPCEEENIPVPPAAADEPDWHPEDATVQVWVGKDSSISDMLVASLRENQISCRPQKADGSRQVFVKPDDERQARRSSSSSCLPSHSRRADLSSTRSSTGGTVRGSHQVVPGAYPGTETTDYYPGKEDGHLQA
jgi:hypothetical protein